MVRHQTGHRQTQLFLLPGHPLPTSHTVESLSKHRTLVNVPSMCRGYLHSYMLRDGWKTTVHFASSQDSASVSTLFESLSLPVGAVLVRPYLARYVLQVHNQAYISWNDDDINR